MTGILISLVLSSITLGAILAIVIYNNRVREKLVNYEIQVVERENRIVEIISNLYNILEDTDSDNVYRKLKQFLADLNNGIAEQGY